MSTTTPWSRWLRDALAEKEWDQAELIRRSNGALNSGELSRWLAGKVIPKIGSIREVCAALGRPAVEGMIAAGHLQPADVGATLIRQTGRAGDLSNRELLSELEARLEDGADSAAKQGRTGADDVGHVGQQWAARRRKPQVNGDV